jgi:SMI1 / KNR4 family (SUKH-1)
MTITISNTYTPITDADIAEFEKPRNIQLPSSYKTFLCMTNGGPPDANLVYSISDMPLNPVGGLQSFFGIKTAAEHDLLEANYDLYVGGAPHGIVPVAGSGGGDFVCLDLRDGTDRVALWDKRHFWGTGEWRESDLYHIADSFDAFLASLRPSPY